MSIYVAQQKRETLCDGNTEYILQRKEQLVARVLGIGGVFFRSRDPKALGDWYREWLGIPVSHPDGASFKPGSMPEGAFTVWAPFKHDTTYFDPSDQQYMFNLVVDNLDEALTQIQRGGAKQVGQIAQYEYGRFSWFIDPEGNKVELWQPSSIPS